MRTPDSRGWRLRKSLRACWAASSVRASLPSRSSCMPSSLSWGRMVSCQAVSAWVTADGAGLFGLSGSVSGPQPEIAVLGPQHVVVVGSHGVLEGLVGVADGGVGPPAGPRRAGRPGRIRLRRSGGGRGRVWSVTSGGMAAGPAGPVRAVSSAIRSCGAGDDLGAVGDPLLGGAAGPRPMRAARRLGEGRGR